MRPSALPAPINKGVIYAFPWTADIESHDDMDMLGRLYDQGYLFDDVVNALVLAVVNTGMPGNIEILLEYVEEDDLPPMVREGVVYAVCNWAAYIYPFINNYFNWCRSLNRNPLAIRAVDVIHKEAKSGTSDLVRIHLWT